MKLALMYEPSIVTPDRSFTSGILLHVKTYVELNRTRTHVLGKRVNQ